MSAARRRTAFAAPFIVTVAASSAAALGGCGKDRDSGRTNNPPAPVFPGPTWSVRMENMKCFARPPAADVTVAPREIECPPGMSGSTVFVVGQLPDGQCGIVPAGCSELSCVKIKTPCPLPAGQKVVHKLANVWLIEKRGDKCHAEEGDEDECPPGTDCNPPTRRFVPCPAGITEDKPVRVAEMPDATCVLVPPGCKDTSCIGDKTACPTE